MWSHCFLEENMIVHILWHGKALCGKPGSPGLEWPPEHVWVGLTEVKEQKTEVERRASWCENCIHQYENNKTIVEEITN